MCVCVCLNVFNVFLWLMFGVNFVAVVGAEVEETKRKLTLKDQEGTAAALLDMIKLMHWADYCMWSFRWNSILLIFLEWFFCVGERIHIGQ